MLTLAVSRRRSSTNIKPVSRMETLQSYVSLLISAFALLSAFGCAASIDNDDKGNSSNPSRIQDDQDKLVMNCKPKHVHISFGNEIVDMKITWATMDKCEHCEVLYGLQPWTLEKKASSNYVNFVEKNKKGLQHLHMSELKSLNANSTYYYTPVCDNHRSGPFYFNVPPVIKDWVSDFLVFGDMGVQTQSMKSVVQEAMSGRYTALIHAGDFAYNLHDKDGMVGDEFMEMIEPAASFLPYMTSPGNHEINDDTFSHYRHRFAMPGSDWPIPINKMWYSLDIGPVHFVSYSSEVFFTNEGVFADVQRKWLLKDLTEANNRRNATPWIVAFGHRPLYCTTKIGDDCSLKSSLVRKGLEQIFYDMKVDILLQAHEHNYERLWPMIQGKITEHSYQNASAPIQIITGAAGSRHGTDHFVRGDQPEWSAFRLGEPALNSYGRMKVWNRTHIWWEQRCAMNHTQLDGIWIIKDDTFQRINRVAFIPEDGLWSHAILAGFVLGGCVVVIVLFGVVRCVVRKRKRNQRREWLSPSVRYDYQDDDNDDEDEEEEEFSQNDYKSSLIHS